MYEPKSNPNYPNHQVARRFVPNAPYRVAHDLHGDWWTSETQAQILCDELISQNETPLARK